MMKMGIPFDPIVGQAPWCSWAPPTPCIQAAQGYALEIAIREALKAAAAAADEM